MDSEGHGNITHVCDDSSLKTVVHAFYTNWRGETATRRFIPVRLWWGHTGYHTEDQWLLDAWDVERMANRTFAMRDFGKWGAPSDISVSSD